MLYVALTRAKARLYLPRFPIKPRKVFKQLKGCYRFIQRAAGRHLQRLHPTRGCAALFHRVAVPCPAIDELALTEAPAATLAGLEAAPGAAGSTTAPPPTRRPAAWAWPGPGS